MSRALKLRHPRGRCRYCRCTEKNACNITTRAARGNPALKVWIACSWINDKENVCSAPSCVKKHRAHERAKMIRGAIRIRHGRQFLSRRPA